MKESKSAGQNSLKTLSGIETQEGLGRVHLRNVKIHSKPSQGLKPKRSAANTIQIGGRQNSLKTLSGIETV